jgi:DNA topoisomerase-1
LVKREGPHSFFYGCSAYPKCKGAFSIAEDGSPVKKAYKAKAAPKSTGKACPDCGSDLLERKSKFGKFEGCSAYPKCKYIKKEK